VVRHHDDQIYTAARTESTGGYGKSLLEGGILFSLTATAFVRSHVPNMIQQTPNHSSAKDPTTHMRPLHRGPWQYFRIETKRAYQAGGGYVA
jgi:hypothetical protein